MSPVVPGRTRVVARDPSGLLDRLALTGAAERVCRVVAALATLAFLAVVPLDGGSLPVVAVAVGVLLAVLVAVLPESSAPLGTVLYLAGLWLVAARHGLDGWTPVAAVDLLVLHLACALASYGPLGVGPGRALLGRWLPRLLGAAAAAPAVWLAARGLTSLGAPGHALVLAAALAALLGWCALVAVRLGHPEQDAGRR